MRLQVPLPEDPPWWELFKVNKAEMYTVARTVHALYQLPKMTYVSVYRGQHQDAVGAKDSTPIVSPPLRSAAYWVDALLWMRARCSVPSVFACSCHRRRWARRARRGRSPRWTRARSDRITKPMGRSAPRLETA